MDALTTDSFFNGRLQIRQPEHGYRFSIDAVLLAGHAAPQPQDLVLDLGTGCGIIPLILAYRNPKIKVYGVEVQQQLADLAGLNVKKNGMEDRIVVCCMDMKELPTDDMIPGPMDLVVSNPPYRKALSGRLNPNRQRAVARHEIKATLADVVETARRMLRVAGRLLMIYPAQRMTDLVIQMRAADIEPKFVRLVHSNAHAAAKLVLVEGKKQGRPGVKVGPPLIIYHEDGSYSSEVQEMLRS